MSVCLSQTVDGLVYRYSVIDNGLLRLW